MNNRIPSQNRLPMTWDTVKIPIYEKWKAYWFETHPIEIAEYSWNYLFTGGKEIRARLFCELYSYLDINLDRPIPYEIAFAIECIHVASLILDDTPWMDDASERRGKRTLHLVFTPAKALLLAHDVMYMVYLIWKSHLPPMFILSEWENYIKLKLQRLILGQWYDLNECGTLVELASLKTGVLFELVVETVAIYTDMDRTFWKIWGNQLGILFQWMDDWNDREEDARDHNRNAFNEDYSITLRNYVIIWNKLQDGIGTTWFTKPFGRFMRDYFRKEIDAFISFDITPRIRLIDRINPFDIEITIPKIMKASDSVEDVLKITHNKKLLYRFFHYLDRVEEYRKRYESTYFPIYLNLKQQIWNIEEKEWLFLPEAIQIMEEVKGEVKKEMDPDKIDLKALDFSHLSLFHKWSNEDR